ncbi:MAG: hypothetical protein EOP84_02155, partial [Verrucomicrobiaceae bacterium]
MFPLSQMQLIMKRLLPLCCAFPVLLAGISTAAPVPEQAEILRRFGNPQTPQASLSPFTGGKFSVGEKEVIVFAGQANLVREQKAGEMEGLLATLLNERRPRFRSMAWEADTVYEQWRDLNFGPWPGQLEAAGATMIVAQFGQVEALDGAARLPEFTAAYHRLLDEFTRRTPRLVLLSPMPFEKPLASHAPDLTQRNQDVRVYVEAIREIARQRGAVFVDLFTPLSEKGGERLTDNGMHLNEKGLRRVAQLVVEQLGLGTGQRVVSAPAKSAILEKNRLWFDTWRPANWNFVYGDRLTQLFAKSLGDAPSLKESFEQNKPLIAELDTRIHGLLRGEEVSVPPPAQSAPQPETEQLSPEAQLATFKMAEGYEVQLFASERDGVVKPTQFSWDERGRLYVACSPTYPHVTQGAKPGDYILVLEDTDGDGKADKVTVFADKLHLPLGFEITSDGVFLSQGTNFMLLKDLDGDDKADTREILLSGFDDHDTHHNIHAFTADPSGAIYMGEGVFLHTDVETSYGPVRATNGGFYRYSPQRRHLERTAQPYVPNPWGIAFDYWGQNFYAETSSPDVRWMMPVSVKPRYGVETEKSRDLLEPAHRVRPTSGLEFISSRHFPDELQGDFIINNTIGFLGTKEHTLKDDGTGFVSSHRQDLLVGADKNFRPVDMEFAPDGSLYIADWHNILIGHMQHNARDPLRDHVHGRIYRMTYPSRPLIKAPKIAGASINELLDNLKLPEYRARNSSRSELRGRKASEVLPLLKSWTARLDKSDKQYEHHLLEALWVTWGLNKVDQPLLRHLLKAKDYHARAAAVRVLRYTGHQVMDQQSLLMAAAKDVHGRVRLEAIVTASWLAPDKGLAILNEAAKSELDDWMIPAYETAVAHLNGRTVAPKSEIEEEITRFLKWFENHNFPPCRSCP